eukprot:360331-Chlamydomonas_euryale.AAC.8
MSTPCVFTAPVASRAWDSRARMSSHRSLLATCGRPSVVEQATAAGATLLVATGFLFEPHGLV